VRNAGIGRLQRTGKKTSLCIASHTEEVSESCNTSQSGKIAVADSSNFSDTDCAGLSSRQLQGLLAEDSKIHFLCFLAFLFQNVLDFIFDLLPPSSPFVF
jgi:hypothetical protein